MKIKNMENAHSISWSSIILLKDYLKFHAPSPHSKVCDEEFTGIDSLSEINLSECCQKNIHTELS